MKPTTLCSNFVSPFHVSHHRDQHHAPGLSRGSSPVDLIAGLRNNVTHSRGRGSPAGYPATAGSSQTERRAYERAGEQANLLA